MRPVTLILAQRLWQGGAGVITISIVALTMSVDLQGWYYSFLSFAALYTLFDLGLSLLLAQLAARLSVHLRWMPGGYFSGVDAARFEALCAFAGRHYLRMATIFICLVIPAGWFFFSVPSKQVIAWQPVWLALTVVTGLSLLPLPILAILEGSGEVAEVASVRLCQTVLGAAATWSVLVAGGGLWATLMMPLASFGVGTTWIIFFRPGVLKALRSPSDMIAWRMEVWPLQWRIGLSWLSGFLLTQIQTLVLFSATGATAAGQMGLSLTIGNMVGLIAQSFIVRHVPAMAKAAVQRDWLTLDRLFRRDFLLFCGTFGVGVTTVIGIVAIMSNSPYGIRMLPPFPFFGLLFALFLGQVQGALAIQLRSYFKEPLVGVAIAGSVATVLLAMPAAHFAATTGVVAVMVIVQATFVLPISVFLFVRYNRTWRKN